MKKDYLYSDIEKVIISNKFTKRIDGEIVSFTRGGIYIEIFQEPYGYLALMYGKGFSEGSHAKAFSISCREDIVEFNNIFKQ